MRVRVIGLLQGYSEQQHVRSQLAVQEVTASPLQVMDYADRPAWQETSTARAERPNQ